MQNILEGIIFCVYGTKELWQVTFLLSKVYFDLHGAKMIISGLSFPKYETKIKL